MWGSESGEGCEGLSSEAPAKGDPSFVNRKSRNPCQSVKSVSTQPSCLPAFVIHNSRQFAKFADKKSGLKRDGPVFFSSAPVKVAGEENTIIAQRDAGPNWREDGFARRTRRPVFRSPGEGGNSQLLSPKFWLLAPDACQSSR